MDQIRAEVRHVVDAPAAGHGGTRWRHEAAAGSRGYARQGMLHAKRTQRLACDLESATVAGPGIHPWEEIPRLGRQQQEVRSRLTTHC